MQTRTTHYTTRRYPEANRRLAGQHLRMLREERELGLHTVATAAGVGYGTLRNFEIGNPVNTYAARRICRQWGFKMSALLANPPAPPAPVAVVEPEPPAPPIPGVFMEPEEFSAAVHPQQAPRTEEDTIQLLQDMGVDITNIRRRQRILDWFDTLSDAQQLGFLSFIENPLRQQQESLLHEVA